MTIMENGPAAYVGPHGLVLRAVRLEDAEGLNALSNLPGSMSGTLGLPFKSLAMTRQQIESTPPENMHLVALLDGQVVGSAGLERFSRRRRHAANLGMAVHDEFTGAASARHCWRPSPMPPTTGCRSIASS